MSLSGYLSLLLKFLSLSSSVPRIPLVNYQAPFAYEHGYPSSKDEQHV